MAEIIQNNDSHIILQSIPFLSWLKDSSGRYVYVNQAFCEAFGLAEEEVKGRTDGDIFTAEKAKEFKKSDDQVIRRKKSLQLEQSISLKDRSAFFITHKTPVFAENGSVSAIAGIAREIADRVWREKTLHEREELFSALLQNSSDDISIIDRNGIILFESSEKSKISDFGTDEVLGRPIYETVHPDDAGTFRQTVREVLANPGKRIKKEYRSLHKNKRWIFVESIFSNQLKNPAIRGIIVNTRDVSDRKMAELKERVYHDNLIFLSNSALELLGLSSKDQIFAYITSKLLGFLGSAIVIASSYDEEEKVHIIESVSGLQPHEEVVEGLLGRSLVGMAFPLELSSGHIEHAGQIYALKDELFQQGIGDLLPDQLTKLRDFLHVHKIYNIILARDNKRLGNITILTLNKSIIKFKHIIETFVHQISVALHRSQLEHELIKAKDRAEESDRLKTAFLANMSHEIRTPMNGILGFAEMLNDNTLSTSNRKKYLEIINSNGKMLINLIDDIIDFAKIESGQVNIVQDDVSLNNLLDLVQSTFLTSWLRKDKARVKVVTRKAFPDDKAFVRTDPIRLRQIYTNLVGNAIKFTHKGSVEFGYNLSDSQTLQCFVKDTGIGIPENKLSMIFERFMQADSSPSRKYGGSGLGLAISKGLVELLGGRMWAESEPGVGSTFYFTMPFLPVVRRPETRLESKVTRESFNWEGKLFLIAEDDKFSYKFLEGFLKQTRAEVIRAADGREAVELSRSRPDIDLILMDIQMPEMNGLTATEEIKKFNPHVPIIAQTANAISEERQRCLQAGCDDFITKPVNINELFSKISKWLTTSVP